MVISVLLPELMMMMVFLIFLNISSFKDQRIILTRRLSIFLPHAAWEKEQMPGLPETTPATPCTLLGPQDSWRFFPSTGCLKKKVRVVFCSYLVENGRPLACDIIHWKGGIHSFVWSAKTFLYDIQGPRYKQIKMGYQLSKYLNIGQSFCLEI